MVDAGRRKFLTGAGLAAAGMAAATVVPSPAESAPAPARVDYPSNRLANVRDLKPNEPLDVAYPDADAPGVLLKLGKRVPTGRRSRRRHRRLLDDLSAQGLSAQLQQVRPHPELPRPLLPLRLRGRRPADLGPGDPEPPAVRAARSTTRATSTPKAWTSCSTAACPTCSEGGTSWLTSVRSTACRSSRRMPRSTTSPATTASSAAATRPTPGP